MASSLLRIMCISSVCICVEGIFYSIKLFWKMYLLQIPPYSFSSFQLNLPEKHTHSKKFLSDWRAISGLLGLDARDECTSSCTCWLSTTFFPSWTMVTSQNSGAFFLINFPFAIFFPSLLKNDEHNPLNRKFIGLESPVTLSVDLDNSFVKS